MSIPKVIRRFFLAWAAGSAAMLVALISVSGVWPTFAALGPVLSWSLALFFVTFFLLGVPALCLLRYLLRGISPGWLFPLLASLTGSLAILVLTLILRKEGDPLINSETTTLYSGVIVVGFVAGIGFLRDHHHANVA